MDEKAFRCSSTTGLRSHFPPCILWLVLNPEMEQRFFKGPSLILYLHLVLSTVPATYHSVSQMMYLGK
jgi:hypothetical protein